MLLRRVQLNRRARNRTRLFLPLSLSLSLSAQRAEKKIPDGCPDAIAGCAAGSAGIWRDKIN